MKWLIANVEFWLSFIGLLFILVLTPLLIVSIKTPWHIMAISTIAVGAFHGLIFWLALRWRKRMMRRQAIEDIRLMLEDRILNQLAVINLNLYGAKIAPDNYREHAERIKAAVGRISEQLKTLSEESLTCWQRRYGDTLARVPQTATPDGACVPCEGR